MKKHVSAVVSFCSSAKYNIGYICVIIRSQVQFANIQFDPLLFFTNEQTILTCPASQPLPDLITVDVIATPALAVWAASGRAHPGNTKQRKSIRGEKEFRGKGKQSNN